MSRLRRVTLFGKTYLWTQRSSGQWSLKRVDYGP